MDDFARLPADERGIYFEQAAAQHGLTAPLMEKDFWVCWMLKRLFTLPGIGEHLTFKGGTSLSKVFNAIERFSEDVDVSIERAYLGFGGEMEPEAGTSGKERQRRIQALKEACQARISTHLHPSLHASIASKLRNEADWTLSIDADDPDSQTLLFAYPPGVSQPGAGYTSPAVKIEMGARSDHFPVEMASVSPYLCDVFPEALEETHTRVRVLGVERTWWEKATILHMLHHQPEGKIIRPRMSRHYYDLTQLALTPARQKALNSLHILSRVAEHKSVFFKSAWAKYEEATPQKLKLTPKQHIVDPLKRDYHAMQEMFFGSAPTFDEIISQLEALEAELRSLHPE